MIGRRSYMPCMCWYGYDAHCLASSKASLAAAAAERACRTNGVGVQHAHVRDTETKACTST